MKQRKKETETLQVYRDWKSSYNQITYLKDNQGKIKAIIQSSIQQPKKNQKQYTLNGITFNLNWNV